ncbi:DUF368 domain-containing protein [Radiobacillus sp. PE A8.2]|uniref:DUF368 domain-containing protein n=1 Tax=Radiobacillus sp. PE A8.2 TaxID=3380349 RepID=UPI0038902D7E
MEWRNIYRGILMGASDVVPGVSGGTIAVVLGIYDRLIEAINGFLSKEWKKHLAFLAPLLIGVGASIYLLSGVVTWLFEHHPRPTQFAFLGLIIGVLPFLFNKSDAKNTFKTQHVVLLVIGAIIVGSMAFFHTVESEPMQNLTISNYLFILLAGFIASSAMILPGISGSFLLYLMGVYTTVFGAVHDLQLDIVAVFGVGFVIGIVIMSKIIHYFMANFPTSTYALVIGLVIGSVAVIFPGWPTTTPSTIYSIIAFAGGLLVAYLLGRIEYKE